MDAIEALLKEHASLRRRLIELENKLGPERKAGWDDQADIDLGAFRRAAKDLLDEMLAHERLGHLEGML